MLSPSRPRTPCLVQVPPQYAAPYVADPSFSHHRAIFAGMLACLDSAVGNVTAALEKAGMWANTLLLFTSDHGDHLGAHGNREKMTTYDESLRVPFLLHWPARVAAATVTDVATSVDVWPTVAGLLGLPPRPHAGGRNCGTTTAGALASSLVASAAAAAARRRRASSTRAAASSAAASRSTRPHEAAGVPWRDHDDTGVPDCDDDGVERGEPPPGRRAFRIERRPDLGFGGFS